MSKVFDMHAKAVEVGDEVNIPCKVIAIHEFEIEHPQVTCRTRQPRAGTKDAYDTFFVSARQVDRTSRPGKFKTAKKAPKPKLCTDCKRHPSACICNP